MQGSRCRSGIGIEAPHYQQSSAGGNHRLLQQLQADLHKTQAPLPVGIDAAEFAAQAHGGTLQIARQHSDRHNQQQPIDACRIGCCSPAG